MKTTRSPNTRYDPRFYLELGQLVSSTGGSSFTGQMLQLVDTLVSVQGIDLSEWTLDVAQARVERITRLLRALQLPVQAPRVNADEFLAAMAMDKKVLGGQIRLVLLPAIGTARVTADFPVAELQGFVRAELAA